MCDKNGISGGVGGGCPLCEPILENPKGMGGHRKNHFQVGGMDISGTQNLSRSKEIIMIIIIIIFI